jgi:regulatory protein
MPKRLEADQLMEFAGRALSARAFSIGELREKLKRRAANSGDVVEVLKQLKSGGLLDDRRFAEHFAIYRMESRGEGKSRILRELLTRRVAPAIARAATEKVFQGVDEILMIERFLKRKCKGVDLKDEKKLASTYRKLRAAGFSSGNSLRVLKMDLNFEESEEE